MRQRLANISSNVKSKYTYYQLETRIVFDGAAAPEAISAPEATPQVAEPTTTETHTEHTTIAEAHITTRALPHNNITQPLELSESPTPLPHNQALSSKDPAQLFLETPTTLTKSLVPLPEFREQKGFDHKPFDTKDFKPQKQNIMLASLDLSLMGDFLKEELKKPQLPTKSTESLIDAAEASLQKTETLPPPIIIHDETNMENNLAAHKSDMVLACLDLSFSPFEAAKQETNIQDSHTNHVDKQAIDEKELLRNHNFFSKTKAWLTQYVEHIKKWFEEETSLKSMAGLAIATSAWSTYEVVTEASAPSTLTTRNASKPDNLNKSDNQNLNLILDQIKK